MKLSSRSNPHPRQTEYADTEHGTDHNASALLRLRWVPSLAVLAFMATAGQGLSPVLRLALSSLVLYSAFKFAAALKQRHFWPDISVEAWAWYLTAWPGMDLKRFRQSKRTTGRDADPRWLARGLGGMALGAATLTAAVVADVGPAVGGWLAIVGLLALVHFGYADVLSWILRRRGFAVRRLFNAPERSTSLNDFWTRRWNVAFVEMDRVLFMPRLRRLSPQAAPFLMLVGSGIMHELALSYPAGSGWGLPLIYFALHGLGMQAERTAWFQRRSIWFAKWWTRALVLAPVALVFHRPFRDALPLEFLLLLKGMS